MKIKNVTGFGIAMPYREYSEELEKQVNEAFNYKVYGGFSDTVVRTEKSASSGKDNDDDEINNIQFHLLMCRQYRLLYMRTF